MTTADSNDSCLFFVSRSAFYLQYDVSENNIFVTIFLAVLRLLYVLVRPSLAVTIQRATRLRGASP